MEMLRYFILRTAKLNILIYRKWKFEKKKYNINLNLDSGQIVSGRLFPFNNINLNRSLKFLDFNFLRDTKNVLLLNQTNLKSSENSIFKIYLEF